MVACMASFTLCYNGSYNTYHLYVYTLPRTESTMKTKDNGDMKDNGTCSTTNDMTANPAYGTTSRIMAHNTTVNPWICEDDELIVMHKNPTYATSDKTMPTNYVQTSSDM